jgi:hypothetical protein
MSDVVTEKTAPDFKTAFKKERLHIYLVSILAILSVSYLISAFVYFRQTFQ